MPLVDSNQQAVWDSLYRCWVDGVEYHYARPARDVYIGQDPNRLIESLVEKGLTQSHRIVLLGAGFGWSGERFRELGYDRLACVDTSRWIQSRKREHAVLPIVNADVLKDNGRRAIRRRFNNDPIDWVISEDVLPILTDGEALSLAQAMRKLARHSVHWLQALIPGGDQDARLNWKSGEDWKAIVSPDLVVVRNEDARVL